MYNIIHKPIFVIVPVIAILFGAIPVALADQNGYNFTVHVPSHQFGINSVNIWIRTTNGYTTSQHVSTQQSDIYWTFNIPPNQGDSIQVCVRASNPLSELLGTNCQFWTVNQEAGSYSISMNEA
jgi:hypothetical protein